MLVSKPSAVAVIDYLSRVIRRSWELVAQQYGSHCVEAPRRKLRGIITRTQNDDVCVAESAQQTFEIAAGRDQDKPASRGVLQNPDIAATCKPISKRTFG